MAQELKVVQRHEKMMFMEVKKGGSSQFHRMRGFTNLGKKSNPNEYERQYVDEAFKRTDITGISISVDFDFDQVKGNPVSDHIVDIFEKEKLGADAIVNIVMVDFSKPIANEEGKFEATQRAFSVIPDSSGEGTDAYKYSGTFKAAGERIDGKATPAEDRETITFE